MSLFFNWNLVDLQCCVSFSYTAKWFSYAYMYIWFFQSLLPYRLLQDAEYTSLGYTVAPGWLSILYLAACVWSESRSVVSDSVQPHGLHSPWNSPGQDKHALPWKSGGNSWFFQTSGKMDFPKNRQRCWSTRPCRQRRFWGRWGQFWGRWGQGQERKGTCGGWLGPPRRKQTLPLAAGSQLSRLRMEGNLHSCLQKLKTKHLGVQVFSNQCILFLWNQMFCSLKNDMPDWPLKCAHASEPKCLHKELHHSIFPKSNRLERTHMSTHWKWKNCSLLQQNSLQQRKRVKQVNVCRSRQTLKPTVVPVCRLREGFLFQAALASCQRAQFIESRPPRFAGPSALSQLYMVARSRCIKRRNGRWMKRLLECAF